MQLRAAYRAVTGAHGVAPDLQRADPPRSHA
jgi:hypothetical protein